MGLENSSINEIIGKKEKVMSRIFGPTLAKKPAPLSLKMAV